MKLYCKYYLFWIKGAEAKIKYKFFLIYVVMGLRVAILRFVRKSTFFMLKPLKILKNWKNYCKNSVFAMKKILLNKNIKIATREPITT